MVEEIAPLCTIPRHDFSLQACMTIFSKLLSIFADSRVTNLVLAICHAWPVCCDLILHWWSFNYTYQSNAAVHCLLTPAPHVLHSPSISTSTDMVHVSQWLADITQKVMLENGEPVPIMLLANKVWCCSVPPLYMIPVGGIMVSSFGK